MESLGFDDEVIFKLANGTHWIQDQYKYWYNYAYNPEATITEEGGRYILRWLEIPFQ